MKGYMIKWIQDYILWLIYVPSMVVDFRGCCSVLSGNSLMIRVSLTSIREWRLSYSVHMYSIRDTFIRSMVSILTSWWSRLVNHQFGCSLCTFFPHLYSNVTTSRSLPLPQKNFLHFFYFEDIHGQEMTSWNGKFKILKKIDQFIIMTHNSWCCSTFNFEQVHDEHFIRNNSGKHKIVSPDPYGSGVFILVHKNK